MKQTGTFFTSKINLHFLNNKSLFKSTFPSGLDEWFPGCCRDPNYMPSLTTKVDPVWDESCRLCQSAVSHQVQAALNISMLSSLKAMFSGNHEPWVLLPPVSLLVSALNVPWRLGLLIMQKKDEAFHRRYILAHACTVSYFLSVLHKKTLLQCLEKENLKFLNLYLTPTRTERKKKVLYTWLTTSLFTCITYSVCPKNLHKECPFSHPQDCAAV